MRPKAKEQDSPYRHGNLPAAVMAITLDLIKEQGVAGVSLREVARRAGVSSTAPFRHFPTKQTLIKALVDQSEELLEQSVIQRVKRVASKDPRLRLEELARAYLEWVMENPERFRLMQSNSIENLVGQERVERYDNKVKDVLLDVLHDARAQGLLRDDVDIELAVIGARAIGVGLAQILTSREHFTLEAQRSMLVNTLIQYNQLLCKP